VGIKENLENLAFFLGIKHYDYIDYIRVFKSFIIICALFIDKENKEIYHSINNNSYMINSIILYKNRYISWHP